MRTLGLRSVHVRGFRNLVHVDVELGPRLNVLSGDNGQGKTSFLEAAYVLATSRSFRTSKLGELIITGGESASVRGVVEEEGEVREQTVGLKAGTRAARIDGKKPPTLAAYAVATPVVVFHPGATTLSAGPGAERRKLLDRAALYETPASLADLDSYTKAMRSRQRVLELRGDAARDLTHWEELAVRHGLAVMAARDRAAASLLPRAITAFQGLAPPGLSLEGRYAPSAPADAEGFLRALASQRTRDRARGSASVGPHRDDVELKLGGQVVRGMASQGQHRAIVIALELAEMDVIGDRRDVRPVLLLDDVSSELDERRTEALFRALGQQRGQVLLTTTRPELIATPHDSGMDGRRDFVVEGGQIRAS
jgi:DNA replication and repair protein RecF